MLELTVLGSGSAGNCTLVRSDSCRLLVDAGLSARQIEVRLARLGLELSMLDAILLTHEHCDHAGGLGVLCKKSPVPVYCNSATARELGDGRRLDWRLFQAGGEFAIKDLVVQSFTVPHDAADPVGFLINGDGRTLGVATDLGQATHLVLERLRRAHTILLETNHDEKLLQDDRRRPWPIKQRIMSRHGHLSNAEAAAAVAELVGGELRRVVLGHLSRDCNTPELAMDCVRGRIAAVAGGGPPGSRAGAAGAAGAAGGTGDHTLPVEVCCATQREVTPSFAVA